MSRWTFTWEIEKPALQDLRLHQQVASLLCNLFNFWTKCRVASALQASFATSIEIASALQEDAVVSACARKQHSTGSRTRGVLRRRKTRIRSGERRKYGGYMFSFEKKGDMGEEINKNVVCITCGRVVGSTDGSTREGGRKAPSVKVTFLSILSISFRVL